LNNAPSTEFLPFDGHTLKDALAQSERLTGWRAGHAYCDRGYKGGPKHLGGMAIRLASQKKRNVTPQELRRCKRRSASEPIIGHTNSDHRMDRNYLKGEDGDKINALLAGCGFSS
jgi:IS5 family transposase